MAGLRVIILGLLAVSCSAHFGYEHRFGDFARQEQPRPSPFLEGINQFLNKLGVRSDDQKCFTLARRPFYVNRLMQYPCFKRLEGIPVVKSYIGPMGPMCMSYFREKMYRHYRIQTCCPGFAMDKMGKCSIRLRQKNRPLFEPRPRSSMPNMMDMAAKMRQHMWQKAKDAMQSRRNMLNMNVDALRQPFRPPFRPPFQPPLGPLFKPPMPPMQPPFRPPMRPPLPPFMNMYNERREQPRPRLTFLKFGAPPMPRPVPRPPMTGMIKIFKTRLFPGPMLMTLKRTSPLQQTPDNRPRVQPQPPVRQPTVRILSNRAPFNTDRRMQEYHPQIPQIPANPRAQRMYPIPPPMPSFPQIPDPARNNGRYNSQDAREGLNQMHAQEGFGAPDTKEAQATDNIRVDLPQKPVQMPGLIVEEGPMNQEPPVTCITTLEAAIQTCLKQSNINVPDVMTAFEPFNDDVSLSLCRAETVIFDCIHTEIKDCTNHDASVARDMLTETAETVRSMCELREVSVTTDNQAGSESQPILSSTEGKGSETIATVESVDAIPKVEKQPEIPAVSDDGKAANADDSKPTESMTSVQAMQEAIQHEVHVQEMRMKEYLLPILIGSGLGFFVIVLIVSLLVCCCCKRKMKRKMKLAKEAEKPPLKDDEIYTIGVAPPVYEVNGIPPMYYEEAKGEKISPRNSAVLEGAEALPEADATQM